MHTKHTTLAFVLRSIPDGEASFTYRLFTRELGLIYARAQSIRMLRARGRYALQPLTLCEITTVRGREAWRVGSAREVEPYHARLAGHQNAVRRARRFLYVVNSLLSVEDPAPRIFDLLEHGLNAIVAHAGDEQHEAAIEALTVLRILHAFGYVEQRTDDGAFRELMEGTLLTEEIVRISMHDHRELVRKVNSALHATGLLKA